MSDPYGKADHLKPYQFKEGNSFSKGRVQGSKNISTFLREFLDVKIIKKDPLTGMEKEEYAAWFVVAALIKKAINGDVKAIREIFDRVEGRPKQQMDVNAEMQIKEFLNEAMQRAIRN